MNRNITSKVSNFLLGNGFYIALTLCLGLIGASGYYLMDSITQDSTPVSGTTQVEMPQIEVSAPEQPRQNTGVTPTTVPENFLSYEAMKEEIIETEIIEDSILDSEKELLPELENLDSLANLSDDTEDELRETEEELLPEEEEVAAKFALPVKGFIIHEHSLEVLSYNETFGDWRVHTGIDIATDSSAPVYAAANGYVTDVFTDDIMGTSITISHDENLESTYSNLSLATLVEVGQSVKMGQQIATVGTTALANSDTQAHLHVSFTEDGVLVDPMDYLPDFS